MEDVEVSEAADRMLTLEVEDTKPSAKLASLQEQANPQLLKRLLVAPKAKHIPTTQRGDFKLMRLQKSKSLEGVAKAVLIEEDKQRNIKAFR